MEDKEVRNNDNNEESRKKRAKELRPVRSQTIAYKCFDDNEWKRGKVTKVGKSSGIYKNTCWIKDKNDIENKIDFACDVESWKYIPKVSFSEDTVDKNKDISKSSKIANTYFTELKLDTDGAQELKMVYATIIPVERHLEPEVVDAKITELENWQNFKAYEIVPDVGQRRIKTRWRINEKEDHDGLKVNIKARLCLRGDEGEDRPRSDSPTASKEMVKTVLAVAANEGWRVESLDAKAAFLQGSELERDVYVEPPKELKREGEIWLLNRAGYGLYDSARLWYLEIVEQLEKHGMRHVIGDEAVFYYRVNDKTEGVLLLHVDDLLALGSDKFHANIIDDLKNKFTFGKIEKNEFRFCGIDIKVTNDGIIISQNDYVDSLEEIPNSETHDLDRQLSKEEFKLYRGAIGKLIWLNEQTRPDISFDSLLLSYHNRDAQVKHLLQANKVIRKAKSRQSFVKFSKIGSFEQLKIMSHTDASHLTIENKSKGVAGRIIYLSNQDESIVSPLAWKAKTIPQACTSAKAAETRAAYMCTDDSVGLARAVNEIYTGKRGRSQINVTMKSDSQSLKDSLESTKQIEEKILRPTVLAMKQMMLRKEINNFDWVESKACHADVLTKKSASTSEMVLNILKSGRNE